VVAAVDQLDGELEELLALLRVGVQAHRPLLAERSLDERGSVKLSGGALVARAGRVDLVPREGLPLGLGRAAALAVGRRPELAALPDAVDAVSLGAEMPSLDGRDVGPDAVRDISGLGEDLAGDGGDGAALGGVRAAGPVSDAVRPEEVLGRRRGRGRGGVARGRRGAPGAHAAVELVLLREDILVAQHGRGRGHH